MEKDSKTFGTLEVSNETWKMRCSGKQPFTLQKIPKPRVQRRRESEWASAIANKAKAFENHIWDTTIVTNCYHIKAAAAAGWLRSWHFVLDVLLLQKNVHFVVTRIIFYTFLAANAVFDAIGDTRRRLIFSINKKGGHCINIF